jgi:quercetin dioxygenase-like cupin family protein
MSRPRSRGSTSRPSHAISRRASRTGAATSGSRRSSDASPIAATRRRPTSSTRFGSSIPRIATAVEEDDLKLTQGSNLVDLAAIPPFDVWGEAVRARRVQGERLTLAIVELAPNAVVPEHRHDNEQLGMVIVGNVRFTIDGETRDLGPGGTWRILSNLPHTVSVGPEGATVIDVFAPVREDWDRFELLPPRQPNWPPT